MKKLVSIILAVAIFSSMSAFAMSTSEFDNGMRKGIDYFNRGMYYEARDEFQWFCDYNWGKMNSGQQQYALDYLDGAKSRISEYENKAKTQSYWQSSASNESVLYVCNCREAITLRTAPSTSAARITDIPLFSTVYNLGYENGFYKVRYNGKVGWVLASYIDDSGLEPQVATYPTYVINCNEYISLRSAASTSADVITRIPLGATVHKTIANPVNGFELVSYNGYLGWAMSYYLR